MSTIQRVAGQYVAGQHVAGQHVAGQHVAGQCVIVQLVVVALLLAAFATPVMAGWDEGVAAFTSKNYQAAAAEFKELVEQTPDGYQSHYMLGLSLQQLGRKEEALHHLRKAYDLNPNDLNTKLSLGRAYYNLRRYNDVSSLLGSVDPSSLSSAQKAAFYQMRGKARLETGQSGLSDFKQLALLKPKDAEMQYLYGSHALKAGQTDAGVAALRKAADLAPKDTEKTRAYVNALIKKGRMTRDKSAKKTAYMQATNVAKTLVGQAPNYKNLMLKVSAEIGAGLYGEAIKTGEQALSKKSTDWLAHYYVGQAYASARKYTEAVGPLEQAKSLAKDSGDIKLIWRQLGYTYEKQKKYTQSIEAYEFAGDQAGVARVKKNEETSRFNDRVEEENKLIKEMEAEAKKLEDELRNLEGGGGR